MGVFVTAFFPGSSCNSDFLQPTRKMNINAAGNLSERRRQNVSALFSSIVNQVPKTEATTLGWGKGGGKKKRRLNIGDIGEATLLSLCMDSVLASVLQTPGFVQKAKQILSPDVRTIIFQKLCEQVCTDPFCLKTWFNCFLLGHGHSRGEGIME